jgi:hypothetical protein
MPDKKALRRALCEDYLVLERTLAQVDYFLAQSQGNDSIGLVSLYPYDVNLRNYELWDKVGRGVGNLKSLRVLAIVLDNANVDDPDWEILARILPHISNESTIELRIIGGRIQGIEEMRAFARTIQYHPAITQFDTSRAGFSFESIATLCSALTTLPNLEYVLLTQRLLRRDEGVPTFQFPTSMTEFLRAPSLRIVQLRSFTFTSSLCQATAVALRQGSSIASLVLTQCSFPEGGSEQIASALKENESLTTFKITPSQDSINEAFYDAMAASLLSNSTLQELSIGYTGAIYPTIGCLSSLFLALGMNKTLRKLHVTGSSSVGSSMGGSLIPALREGLGKNSTLETLEILAVAHVTSFHIAVVEALQLNKTLKTLRVCYGTQNLNDDEVKHLTSVVKKNYVLESLTDLDSSDDRMGDLRSILRLNRAGRGYLLDGHESVLSKGVDVLSAVSDDLNCVFLHLSENPSLCNRRH